MELFEVDIQHKDMQANKEYERVLQARRSFNMEELPRPEPKRVTYRAAVYGAWGANQVTAAARVALKAVIGEESTWEEWEALVTAVRYVGSVAVEQ